MGHVPINPRGESEVRVAHLPATNVLTHKTQNKGGRPRVCPWGHRSHWGCVTSPGKDQNSKSEIRFLLNARHSHPAVKLKDRSWTIVNWGPDIKRMLHHDLGGHTPRKQGPVPARYTAGRGWKQALAGLLSGLGAGLRTERAIPSQGTWPGHRPGPQLGM